MISCLKSIKRKKDNKDIKREGGRERERERERGERERDSGRARKRERGERIGKCWGEKGKKERRSARGVETEKEG